MKRNIGNVDKYIRLILATVLVILFYANVFSGLWGILVLMLALILTATSLLNYCPLYDLFKINTKSKKNH